VKASARATVRIEMRLFMTFSPLLCTIQGRRRNADLLPSVPDKYLGAFAT
jgi:hypothetical protein